MGSLRIESTGVRRKTHLHNLDLPQLDSCRSSTSVRVSELHFCMRESGLHFCTSESGLHFCTSESELHFCLSESELHFCLSESELHFYMRERELHYHGLFKVYTIFPSIANISST